MDWNVFFSTISQTAGAIVGIFSAFLITKIISNQTTYSQKKDQTTDYLAISKKLENESSKRYFIWYGERKADDALYKIRRDYEDTKLIQSPEYYYDLSNFSPFEAKKDSLKIIQNEIDKITEEKRIEDEALEAQLKSLKPGYGLVTHAPVKLLMPPNSGLRDKITEERDLINDLYVRIQFQAEKNQNLLNDLENNSESSTLISISIFSVISLFFCGVIYPLSFLPMVSGTEISLTISAFWDLLFSLKGALLVVISVIFGGLMIVFLHANYKLKYSQELKDELKKYSDPRNYSFYFKNYVDNSAVESE
ncbi:hypothetical protein J522_1930 [Acinetobacter baumannii 146457]|nr:hypothetical protein J522_1930 [Acinetobacter baumannii 146457]